MTSYIAPLDEILLDLSASADIETILGLPGYEDYDMDTLKAVLYEAAKVAGDTLVPLYKSGDIEGSRLIDGDVKTPKGWKEAHEILATGGWVGLSEAPEYGGQGFPYTAASAVSEIWQSANSAFSLCNILTQGAISAIEVAGSDLQKQTYLPNMIDGTWTGTMNLTEPQAGSNLAAIRTIAKPDGDAFKISGQKIFISYGDHDLTENIIHLVLARTPGAPEGVKGLSLFIVPKFHVSDDGSLGERNDINCVSLEHKLGIHASPTAVMAYGDEGGATGYLLGDLHSGINTMFIMMNAARYEIGLSGLAISEAAYQAAKSYALERKQGKALEDAEEAGIARHPDVMRMLMNMKAKIAAMRSLSYFAVSARDKSLHSKDEIDRLAAQAEYDYLIPIVKAWLTETSQSVTYDAVQIHGGWGFIEETGVAQFARDARINTLYEGTTGIQSADLTFRKTARDGGKTARQLLSVILGLRMDDEIRVAVQAAVSEVEVYLDWLIAHAASEPRAVAATADSYLHAVGNLIGASLLGQSAVVAAERSLASEIVGSRAKLAQYFANSALAASITALKGAMATSKTIAQFEESCL